MKGRRTGWVALTLAVAWVGGTAVALADGGTIRGKVTFKGEKPKRKVIKMEATPFCQQRHGEKKVGTEDAIVNKNGTLRNVLVSIKDGLGDRKFDPSTEPVVLNQEGCVYKPHVLGVQIGQPFQVMNSDETLHNIHGLPKKNEEFNFAQPKANMKKELMFKRSEHFRVKCDVHPWMGAYVGVFEHPFFSVTGKKGAFEIANVPAGEYTLQAWHEVYGVMEQTVTVPDGESVEVEFIVEPK